MLEAAKTHESQLNECMSRTVMDPYYKWYHLSYAEPIVIIDDTFYNKIQLVSIQDDAVQGYFVAGWQRPENYIDSIMCVNFNKKKNKNTFALDLRGFLKHLVNDLNVPKIMWTVAIGNPIEKHYDRIIKRFSGRIVGVEKYAFLINGKYYDRKGYEWINDYYECTHCDNKEKNEREVMCWKCDLGEMVYRNPFRKGKF